MNVQPIRMTRFEARETLRDYRSLLKEKRTKEDIAIMRSAKAIAAGKQVIRLTDVIEAGGYDTQGFPQIAVARADDPWVKCIRLGVRVRLVGVQSAGEWTTDWGTGLSSVERRMRMVNPRAATFNTTRSVERVEAFAMVPMIPPAHRPDASSLERFYILFEADWQHKPPVDPALLTPLGAGMFAVVAIWDLSELERAVLATARTRE